MKKVITLLLMISILFSTVNVMAYDINSEAKALYEIGMLKGTAGSFSVDNLELDRYATRSEVCVTVIRLLGKEEKALYQKNTHPFKDVPDWATYYVGWLYENYLVNGLSDTYFGGNDSATVRQFSAMLMRVLGYDDSEGDFEYSKVVKFAYEKGILRSSSDPGYLTRELMIDMSYRALTANIKNSSRKLIDKLCDEKVVKESLAISLGLKKEASISDSFANLPENLGGISVKKSGDAFKISFDSSVEHFGVRVFVKEKGTGSIREIAYDGDAYLKKGTKTYKNGGSAGYISEIYVYGLDLSGKYEFIVIKTSSESSSYQMVSKSGVAEN